MPAHVVLHAGLKRGHCRPGAVGWEAVAVKGEAGADDDAKLIHFNFCRQLFPENVWILGSPLHKRPCPSQPAARCWPS